MFEDNLQLTLDAAKLEQILEYLRSLSSKGVKRRGIQALRAYIDVLVADGLRKDNPMTEATLSLVHTDPPSLHDLRNRLAQGGISRTIVHRLTWRDLTLLSLRARPFHEVSRQSSGLASLYLDGKVGGRRVLRILRARAHRQLSEA